MVVIVDDEVSCAAIIRKIMWLTMSASLKVLPSSSAMWVSTVMSVPSVPRFSATRSVKVVLEDLDGLLAHATA